jgi:hypothetical protein
MFERMKPRGKVTVRVLDSNGNIKRRKPGIFRRLLKLPGKKMESIHHNIITYEGDALIADWVSKTPVKSKLMYMQVGTGWTGNSPKSNTGCNSPTGSRFGMASWYPKIKGNFGSDDDNVTVYKSIFMQEELNANGINEIVLMNAYSGGDCLAYAQIVPEVNVTLNDSLTVEWEITFLGT